jgi:hypothetical protein
MGTRARRRVAVVIALAGLLGGALVTMSSVDGLTATSPGHGGGSGGLAAAPPSGMATASPTHGATGSPTRGFSAATRTPGGSPTRTPRATATATATPVPRGIARSSATATPTSSTTRTPRAGTGSTPTPTPNGRSTPTPRAQTNSHNPNWPSDSRSWRQWNSGWQDPSWRQEHSRDSRHEQGFFRDPDHFCDSRDCDRFHVDEFRSEDNDFRHDCDILLGFHSVRALLDFLDGDSSLRDFFELHGDLYDFLVNHPDWSDDFAQNCTLIDLHL